MLITEKDGFFNNANRKSTRTSHMENKVKQTWRSLESRGGGGGATTIIRKRGFVRI